MATATKRPAAKKAAPARKRAVTRKPVEKSTMDYLHHALDDLKKAREQATHDVRSGIDSAIDRIRKTLSEMAEEVRRPGGKRA
jgi:hypothetical protein